MVKQAPNSIYDLLFAIFIRIAAHNLRRKKLFCGAFNELFVKIMYNLLIYSKKWVIINNILL